MSALAAVRRGRRAAPWLALALAMAATSSLACGACDEDSVAATYDHRVVEQARRDGSLVVYCRLEGPFGRAQVVAAARRIAGVRKSSVRASRAPAALSFALDPAVQTADAAVAAIGAGLHGRVRLHVIEVVATPSSRRAP